ncbi:unnamed protein product [Plutella xylostella]|uniref:(diamondback moth) hypothetical protein n=1 Tax=Plutella xylostella TaxID=51655 RepID=A0A8S4FYJ6_PLUXY|nr:unnamed protein product [Plutella xylostella]
MKVYCLSSDAAKPCFVISFRGLMIMLDCGLSAQSVLSFLPLPPVPSARLAALPSYSPPHINDPLLEGELKECCGRVFVDSLPEFCPPLEQVVDFAQLDAILISNYTCMMALPFVTEGTGFKGQVYATEPTLQIGRFYLEELSEWLREAGGGAGGGAGGARRWKELLHLLPAPLSQAARPRAWRRLYSAQVLAKALARVRVVGYDERVELFGALEASPVSSGFCLGSANWVLRSPHEKIAYVSGSSTLTTHPRPINQVRAPAHPASSTRYVPHAPRPIKQVRAPRTPPINQVRALRTPPHQPGTCPAHPAPSTRYVTHAHHAPRPINQVRAPRTPPHQPGTCPAHPAPSTRYVPRAPRPINQVRAPAHPAPSTRYVTHAHHAPRPINQVRAPRTPPHQPGTCLHAHHAPSPHQPGTCPAHPAPSTRYVPRAPRPINQVRASTLTTHPRPINQAALRGADLLLLAGLTQTPAHNPDNMLGDLCVHAGVTLRGGGAVLLPVYPSGVLYDLLECLSMHLDTAGLSQIPLYVISPVADASLAYSNILAEWVSTAKQARVYVPEEPFPHAALARAGRLRHAARLHDHSFSEHFRTPCVVFCGHPSLRFGAAVHLLELWAANPAHAVIFTEPDFPYLEALAPFQPLAMKAFHCPIDTSLNYSQCNKLVRELRPRALAVPEQYAPPRGAAGAGGAGAGARACVTADVPVLALRRGGVAAVAARRTLARAAAAPALLPALRPRAPLTAELHVRDNVLTLLPPPAPLQPSAEPDYDLGPPNVDALVRCLAAEGLGAARVEASPAGAVLHLPRHDALLHVERAHTHVFCEPRGRPALRRALRAAARRDPAPL